MSKAPSKRKPAAPDKKKTAARRKKDTTARGAKTVAVRKTKKASAKAPMAAAAILSATSDTIDSFVISINTQYQLHLPTLTDFPAGTIYYQMWRLPVEVIGNPSPKVLKTATATTAISIPAKVASTVFIEVRQA